MSVNLDKMPPLFDDDGPYTYPDGSPIPVGMAIMLACSEHISTNEALQRLYDGWNGKGNRAQRRQRKKKCRQ